MKQLLCVGEYNPWNDYPPLEVSFQDLFRFLWNRCVQQEYVVDEVLEDIFKWFTERMAPARKEEPSMDMTLDFENMPLFSPKEEVPRHMVIGENQSERRELWDVI